ncbi:MAG: hypothetical protein IJH92_06055 [Mogibacterium sp.]|nr:hypothetical protein [Mogibacterium sp.]
MKDKRVLTSKRNIWIILAGLVFSSLTVAGICYDIADEDTTIVAFFKDHTNSFIMMFCFLAIAFMFVIGHFFLAIDKHEKTHQVSIAVEKTVKPSLKQWLIIASVILIAWTPYLIIMFPGTEAGLDYFWQLIQGCGAFPLSNHHPVFGSLIFGILYKIGYVIGGASGGIFFTCLFQMVLMSLSIAYCLATLIKLGAPKAYIIFSVVFFSLCPVFPTNAMWAVKDSVFSSIAVLLFFSVFLYAWGCRNSIKVSIVGSPFTIALLSVLFSIYRNGTSIVAILTMLMVIVYTIEIKGLFCKETIKSVTAIVIMFICIMGWTVLVQNMEVYPTNFRESCAIPTRQILRAYAVYPEKFTEEQKDELEFFYRTTLERTGSLEDIDIGNNPLIADDIKPSFFRNSDEVRAYIKLWLQIGLQNPEIYVDQALHGSYAYWWIGYDAQKVYHAIPLPLLHTHFEEYDYDDRLIQEYFAPIPQSLDGKKEILEKTMPDYLTKYKYIRELIYTKNVFEGEAERFQSSINHLKAIPIISIFLAPGIYTWIIIFAFTYLFSRKKPGRMTWPILLITAMACLSPVNGYMRYVLPIDLMSIIILGMCFISDTNKEKYNGDIVFE